jgi:hypothetical protein
MMNNKQRIVLSVGALVFVALGLYVPWHNAGSIAQANGNIENLRVLWHNSQPEPHWDGKFWIATADWPLFEGSPVATATFDHSLRYAWIFRPPQPASRIDLSRLAVEWLSLIVLTGSLVIVLRKKAIENVACVDPQMPQRPTY